MFSLARPFSQFSRCVRVPHTLTSRRLGRWCSGNAGKAVEAPTSRRRWRVRDVVKTGLVAGTLYFLYKQNVGSPYLFERGVTPEFLDSVLARQGVVESLDEVIEGGTRQRIVMVEMQKSVIPGTDPPISTAGCDVTVMPAMPWYMFSPFLFSRDVRQTWRAIKDHDPEKEVVVIFADTGVFGKHLKAYKRPWPPASGVTEVNYQRRPPPTACHLSTVTDTILGDKEMVTSFAKAVRQKRAEAGGVSEYVPLPPPPRVHLPCAFLTCQCHAWVQCVRVGHVSAQAHAEAGGVGDGKRGRCAHIPRRMGC